MDNIELKIEDAAIRAIAKQALERGTGARGLRSILEEKLLDTMYELPSVVDKKCTVLTEESVNSNDIQPPVMLGNEIEAQIAAWPKKLYEAKTQQKFAS